MPDGVQKADFTEKLDGNQIVGNRRMQAHWQIHFLILMSLTNTILMRNTMVNTILIIQDMRALFLMVSVLRA